MSTLRLGRLTLDSSNVKVTKASFGDGLSLGFTAHQTAGDAGWGVFTTRQQVQGQEGQLIALTWSTDSKWDGFYEVGRVSADVVHAAPQDRLTIIDFSVDLKPVAPAAIDFESTLVGGDLPNEHALTGDRWTAPPAGTSGYVSDTLTFPSLRSTTDGTIQVWSEPNIHSRWASSPANWLNGAAEIRQNLAVLTGLQSVDPPGVFEINNGLLRARWIVGEVVWEDIDGTWDDMDLTWDEMGGVSGVQISTWRDGAWRSKTWDLDITPDRVAVLRNDPHVVTVRLIEELTPGRNVLDLTLRRGSSALYGFYSARFPGTRTVMGVDADPATVIDGGVKATSATPEGATWVAATTVAHTADTTQGGFTVPDADRMVFMVGFDGGSAHFASRNTAEHIVEQWIGHTDEAVRAELR